MPAENYNMLCGVRNPHKDHRWGREHIIAVLVFKKKGAPTLSSKKGGSSTAVVTRQSTAGARKPSLNSGIKKKKGYRHLSFNFLISTV